MDKVYRAGVAGRSGRIVAPSEYSYSGRMAQGQSVIYLPPGVAIAPSAAAPPAQSGVPFDKAFFQAILPGSIKSFCEQASCDTPVVELLTTDGSKHFVKGISGVADQWVALHTEQEDHEHPVQVFIPYQTIYRVEIHPHKNHQERRLGFIASLEAYDEKVAVFEAKVSDE
jgi:hypothetical protein